MESLRYACPPDTVWRLFLFGDVPDLQLDWIWRPAPDALGPTPQHVQHLHALVQHFDVPDPAAVTLTIGNLSLLDSRHMPGRGALAIVAHLRLLGSRDHSGRPNPPLVVALVALDRDLDGEVIEAAASGLLAWVTAERPAGERPIDEWYGRYVLASERGVEAAAATCAELMEGLPSLRAPGSGVVRSAWRLPERESMPDEVEVLADQGRDAALHAMAGLAAELYRSRLKWSALSTGRPAQRATDSGTLLCFLAPRGQDGPAPALSRLPREPDALLRMLLPVEPDGLDMVQGQVAEAPLIGDPGALLDPEPIAEQAPAPPVVAPSPPAAPGPTGAPPPASRPTAPRSPPLSGPLGVPFVGWFAVALLTALLLVGLVRSCQPTEAHPTHAPAPRASPGEAAPGRPSEPIPGEPVQTAPEPQPAAPSAAPSESKPRTPSHARAAPAQPAPVTTALVSAPAGMDCELAPDGSAGARTAMRGDRALPPGDYTLLCQVDASTPEWEEQRTVSLEVGGSYQIVCLGAQCVSRRR